MGTIQSNEAELEMVALNFAVDDGTGLYWMDWFEFDPVASDI